MKRICIGRDFQVPAQRVWDLITDTAQWPLWGPSVRAVRCPDRIIRQGSQGVVQTPVGLWLAFVITRCDPPRRWDWKVAGIPATGHRVVAFNEASCRLVFELPLVAMAYVIVCRRALANIARLCETNLK
jgi:uncharacterized protein YndB with AHSA1/START domain